MAKVLGIEPSSQGFGDLRITIFPDQHNMVPHGRIELPSEDYKAPVLPLY